MIDGMKLVKGELECYNCGCNLKPVCADYERALTQLRVQRLHENAKLPVRAHPTDVLCRNHTKAERQQKEILAR